jgi:hypothetical protein
VTNSARVPDPKIVDHLITVLRALVKLLNRFDERARADWLATHLATLEDPSASPQAVSESIGELHQIVLGMGGLMDLHLSSISPEETSEANRELERLADQLFELTR